ncbi:MAG TPA: hypothetical protein VN372_00850 [Methanospirillum sp.]|nr:hypothetical protein [Methanospirillum sp.]
MSGTRTIHKENGNNEEVLRCKKPFHGSWLDDGHRLWGWFCFRLYLPYERKNLNLIFVVPPDLANDPLGDINPQTANLNNQGLQRSLLMGSYLKHQSPGSGNATAIYTLIPMTHLQTGNNYPDMVAIGFIQQFALLNTVTVQNVTGNSFPIYAGYVPGDVPPGVAELRPFVPAAQGLVFNDTRGNLPCCLE